MPVLVMAEGFPVNPMTSLAIEERLKKAHILQGPKIAPLHVIDRDELSLVEGLAEHQGALFEEILARHERAAFRGMGLKDWLLVEEHVQFERPSRLREPFERAWQPVMKVVRTAGENSGQSRGPNQGAKAPASGKWLGGDLVFSLNRIEPFGPLTASWCVSFDGVLDPVLARQAP